MDLMFWSLAGCHLLVLPAADAFSPVTSQCRPRQRTLHDTIKVGQHKWATYSGNVGPHTTTSAPCVSSSTRLHLFSRPSITTTASLATFLISIAASYLLGRRSGKKRRNRPPRMVLSRREQQQLDQLPPTNQTDPLLPLQDDLHQKQLSSSSKTRFIESNLVADVNTPIWINFAFARVWTLFQKNTKRLISDTIQPILDDLEHPPFVKSIRLVKFTPGQQSPLLNTIRRLPSRALAEVQYAAHGIFASTSTTEFAIHCQGWGNLLNVTVPVTVTNLDIDADVWIRTRLAPYEPFLTAADWGFRTVPSVTFDLESAGIPITAIPAVRTWLVQLLTKDIPAKFVVPNVVTVDFMRGEGSASDVTPPLGQPMSALSTRELRTYFPEQAALFDAMDVDSSGSLSVQEIYQGLVDWGYTAHDAVDTFQKMDRNHDDEVSLAEFCEVWPSLAASFVPDRYQGELVCFVRRAELAASRWATWSDPRVTVALVGGDAVPSQQRFDSKWDSQTSVTGGVGRPVFLQRFEFKSTDLAKESLEVSIQERWGRRTIGIAKVPLKSIEKRSNQSLVVDMTNGHRIWLELSYAEYVKNVVPRPSPSSQELSAATIRQHQQQQAMSGVKRHHESSKKHVSNVALDGDMRQRGIQETVDDLPWQ